MINWSDMFAFDTPILEILVRGTCVYWALFIIMRYMMKRGGGSVGMSDLLVVVLLGDAIQNAMAGDYKSISDGILLVLVLVGWDYLLDYLSYHFTFVRPIFQPGKVCLIKDGHMNWPNMKTQLINEDLLMSQLRLNDAADLKDVKEAYLETNGEISVIKNDSNSDGSKKKSSGAS